MFNFKLRNDDTFAINIKSSRHETNRIPRGYFLKSKVVGRTISQFMVVNSRLGS